MLMLTKGARVTAVLARLEASLIVLLLALARRVARFPTPVPSASKQSEDGRFCQLHALRCNASVTKHLLSADCAAADFFRIRRAPHVRHGALAARALLHGQVRARRAFRILVTRVRESRMTACRRSRKKKVSFRSGENERNMGRTIGRSDARMPAVDNKVARYRRQDDSRPAVANEPAWEPTE
jgi:hypothetical protein